MHSYHIRMTDIRIVFNQHFSWFYLVCCDFLHFHRGAPTLH
jgi:hypothetical protein